MDISAYDLISRKAWTWPFGSPVLACAGKTDPPSHLILSQTSASKLRAAIVWSLGSGHIDRPRLEVSAVSQNAPGEARQLVGKRDREHVVVQPFLRRLEQGLRPWRSQLFGLISTTHAARTHRTRR